MCFSPTKTLQQKLAERQRQFHDANSQSRPSSTSNTFSQCTLKTHIFHSIEAKINFILLISISGSAGSSKTRKSDNDVIVLD